MKTVLPSWTTPSMVAAAVAIGLSAGVAHAELVYDNTGSMNASSFHNGTIVINNAQQGPYEFGDDLTLAGASRLVNQFVFHYFGDIAANAVAMAKVRFYANDTPILDPVTGKTVPGPGTLLWTSDPFQIERGQVEKTLDVPLVQVPNTFTFTLEAPTLTGASGNQVGLYTSSSVATVGTSYNDFWEKTPSGWVVAQLPGARADFTAKVSAVPEPGTVALGTLGAGAVVWMLRRRNSR